MAVLCRYSTQCHPIQLPKLLVGIDICEHRIWFQPHHDGRTWTRVSSDFDTVTYNLRHTDLMNRCAREYEERGCSVTLENQHEFRVSLAGATVYGRMDLVATRDQDLVIIDARAAKPSEAHAVQVMLYVLLIGCSHGFHHLIPDRPACWRPRRRACLGARAHAGPDGTAATQKILYWPIKIPTCDVWRAKLGRKSRECHLVRRTGVVKLSGFRGRAPMAPARSGCRPDCVSVRRFSTFAAIPDLTKPLQPGPLYTGGRAIRLPPPPPRLSTTASLDIREPRPSHPGAVTA